MADRTRTLDVRLESRLMSLLVFAIGVVLAVLGSTGLGATLARVIVVGLAALLRTNFRELIALAMAVLGAVLVVRGYRGLTTLVRFTVAGQELLIEWRRGRRVVRTEGIALDDLVDIAIAAPPSSAGTVRALVVGTRHGDLALATTRSRGLGAYTKGRDRLATFLKLPAR